jgi:uncharacterized protein (TIGR00369 family)
MTDTPLSQALTSFIDSPQNLCFVCGRHNPSGLHVHFDVAPAGICASWMPNEHHVGWQGVVHGGVLASLLDEAMAYTLFRRGIMGVTARLEVRYRTPAHVGEELHIEATTTDENRRIADIAARITAGERVVAEASARFVKVGELDAAMLGGAST